MTETMPVETVPPAPAHITTALMQLPPLPAEATPDEVRDFKRAVRRLADRLWAEAHTAGLALGAAAQHGTVGLSDELTARVEEHRGAVSWPTVEHRCGQLAEQVAAGGLGPQVIVGLSRGGLPVATLLAHRLGVPYVTGVGVEFTGPQREHTRTWCMPMTYPTFDRLLIVEDAVDTGRQMAHAVSLWASGGGCAKLATAALYATGRAPHQDFVAVRVNSVPQMPWEVAR